MNNVPRILVMTLFAVIALIPLWAGEAYTLSDTGAFVLVNRFTVVNTSNQPTYNVKATVQVGTTDTDSPYQSKIKVVVQPKWVNRTTDAYGNHYALFDLGTLQPGERRDILIEKHIRNSAIAFSPELNGIHADYAPFKAKKANLVYLAPSEAIQSSAPEFKREAFKFDTSKSTMELAKDIFGGVNMFLQYDKSRGNTDALTALKTGRGVCTEFASLFVAMCRALDIPARVVTGYWYTKPLPLNQKVTFVDEESHAWAEFYLPSVGWIPVEPTAFQILHYRQTGQATRVPSYDFFAKIRPGDRHFIWAYGTEKREQPSVSISYSVMTQAGAPENPNTQFLDAKLTEESVMMIPVDAVTQ